ncbi:MAG TPA: DUF5985 family protein [Vicinamibacterales bacterium]|nr:DUF5985 family protein [Vicinamibacterales bacterium]
MMTMRLAPFALGAVAMASLVVALFFVRFYRDSRDTLFLYFAAAFAIESVNRGLLAFAPTPNEGVAELYLLRAFAYSLIVVGIYRKNQA